MRINIELEPEQIEDVITEDLWWHMTDIVQRVNDGLEDEDDDETLRAMITVYNFYSPPDCHLEYETIFDDLEATVP